MQPTEVGTFFSAVNLTPASGGVALNVTVSAATFSVLYYADPVDYSNLCDFIVTPSYNLPGETDVVVNINAASIHGLNGDILGTDVSTQFKTGEGPGIINAPVSPDVIYVGVGGPDPGVSAIDLNGFGQGTNGLDPDPITGKPTRQPSSTNWPNNPNIGQPGVSPSLSVGTTTLDAGSNGVLTLVQDTQGETLLLRKPLVGRVTDIHIGAPLDLVFNNENINVNANGANQINPATLLIMPGNSITNPPHPNPPRLVFPPPNPSRAIFAEEPSVTSSQGAGLVTASPPCSASPVNQLVGGFKGFSQHFSQGVFYGPQAPPASPPPPPPFCPYTARQQIGHFLYILDRDNDRVLIVNSNRFTVLDTLRLSDPINMTMSPTLALLAVANFASSTISFIDTDPTSGTFNTVIAETRVVDGPTAIAWQPDGEAVLVLSTPSNTLTVLQAADFTIITEVSGNLNLPFQIAVTERFIINGNLSGVYYAYILNENGSVAVFESGPSGVNGIGFQDMIGTVDLIFSRARGLQLDYTSNLGGIFVSHVDESGVGKVSRLELTASPTGQQPTNQLSSGFILPPTFRQKQWTVTGSFGGSDPNLPLNQRLSGNSPIDVAFDEMLNGGALPNQLTPFNGGVGQSFILHSSKGAALLPILAFIPSAAYIPRYIFIALSDTGKIDVFDLNTEAKITSIDVPGVTMLASYWRQ